jgi:hypothetical protein
MRSPLFYFICFRICLFFCSWAKTGGLTPSFAGLDLAFPCRVLFAGDHLNVDAIVTTVIISNDQGGPARLSLLIRFSLMNLIDCCVSAAVACCDAILPPPIAVVAAAVH